MKAKELMIGDLVKFNNSDLAHQIKAIAGKSVKIDKVYWYSASKLSPIPITSEILEKNGFRKSVSPPGIHAKCYEIEDKDKKYCLTIANYNRYKRLLLNVDSEDSECFNIKCDYVHQLQHALRLCGIEKEIIL